MYLWKPNDLGLLDYKVSISKRKLVRYIEKAYPHHHIVFQEYEENITYVEDTEENELGYISLIAEV